jgi:hypothetical protein
VVDHQRPSDADHAGPSSRDYEAPVDDLREILFGRYRQRIAELEAELDELEQRVTDEDALVALMAPVMGDAIRRRIRDARDEMIEALYPIVGRVVVRAVREAVGDLARSVDAQVRTSFDPQTIWWRLRARFGGASKADVHLRERLPFEVSEIFLIHRETGLLLQHVSNETADASDSDLIGSMLTAIRDFAQDAFGRGREGGLDEIEYGDRRILIEATEHGYLAVVLDGVEPPGFRAEMRERIVEVEHGYAAVLRDFEGDATPFEAVTDSLCSLMAVRRPHELTAGQKRLLAGSLGLVILMLAGACALTGWVWRTVRSEPPAPAMVVAPTERPTPTATPSPSATWSPTASHTPTLSDTPTLAPTTTATATWTPTPAPVIGIMTGNVWLRAEPAPDAARPGVTLARGQQVEVLAVAGDWYRVRWVPQAGTEVVGWVPAQWVGTVDPIPTRLVTPSANQ